MALTIVPAENSTDARELAGVNLGTLDSIDALFNANWDGLLCAIALISTPIVGTVYGVTRCLWKTSATDVWNCVVEDIKVTLTAWAATTIGLCWLDPLSFAALP